MKWISPQAEMVKFIGPKNVSTVKHKILSTLNTALQLKDQDGMEGS